MLRTFFLYLIAVFLLCSSETSTAQTTKLKWFGHAAFQITTPKGAVFLIDPWLKNPKNPDQDSISKLSRVDYILITHGHFDHVGEAVEISKKTGARLVTNFELGSNLVRALGFPAVQADFSTLMNIGGTLNLATDEVQVAMTAAVHSSSLELPQKDSALINGGNAAGFVLKIQQGPTIYHTGDTAYFSDMKLIAETYTPAVALINAGGHFGMDQKMAAKAGQAVGAKLVIPHHFGTFPILAPDVTELFKELDHANIAHYEMKPGEEILFLGKEAQVKLGSEIPPK